MNEPDIPVWERRTLRLGVVLALAAFALLAAVAWKTRPGTLPPWLTVPLSALLAYGLYRLFTRKVRNRRRLRALPFPPEWEAILQREVVFYRTLEPAERERFRHELRIFLGEKRITGIGTPLDETTRVLAGASAIIPIFGFPDWEWDQIEEVLIYPSRFGRDYEFGESDVHRTLGMVGTGAMNRLMILSKPDLLQGFRNPGDKRNVGIHEFAHLLDKSDGAIDGLPGVGLDRRSIGPWVELVRRKMEELRRGRSDIDPYGLTNEAEFFAVATEYFFERPGVMQRKHPELYAMLARVFRQDLRSRARAMLDAAKLRGRGLGRNSPCPCGSGVKYKKCCLARSRRARAS